ncbi:YcaO-like family protein [Rhizobium oryzicola]|uniref:YcaO-like family protein n=1 Tax=Rhizobium oryzicola TaxID=1232668 RepID=A0ABT8T0U9_9HYPH|nr:YcaO-like family protein [Rhizobium oryzicola]MDO1583507.1 YcaO-like family protein [Rhizobium oryzicola]
MDFDRRTSFSCDRVCQPLETWQRIQGVLPSFGITRLSRLTGLDMVGIPVWNAVSPNAKSIVINQGKGVSDIDARVSAAMEALERQVAASPCVVTVEATARELATAGERYELLPQLIAAGESDLDVDEVMIWVKGQDLVNADIVWIPFHAVTLDRTSERCRFWQSSDGLASGNNAAEAVLHGLLERIERDADVLWRLQSTTKRLKTCIDPGHFGDSTINSLLEKYAVAGLKLRAFDLTSDIAVPCYAVVCADNDILRARQPRFHDITVGYGAHPVAQRAMIRALTEVAQSRLTYISGARDDVFPETYSRPLAPDTQMLFEAEPHAPEDYPAFDEIDSPSSLLESLLHRLKMMRINSVIAVQLHAPDLPVAVVKVIVPDLENPDGARRHRWGPRALAMAIGTI